MADMKGITCCGDCFYYDWNKKRCKRGTSQDDDPKAPFFADCPLPSVEPERPKGRWKRVYDDSAGWVDMCTNCEEYGDEKDNFCPNCGTDMRKEN